MWEAKLILKCGEIVTIQLDSDENKKILIQNFNHKNEGAQNILNINNLEEQVVCQVDLQDVSFISYEKLKSNNTEDNQV